MAEDRDLWIEATTKLIKLTQNGKIKWTPSSNQPSRGSSIIDSYFTVYKGKRLRIYQQKVHSPNATVNALAQLGGQNEIVRLEIVDDSDNRLWPFPQSNSLADLHRAVKYQAAGVTDFLNEILNEAD